MIVWSKWDHPPLIFEEIKSRNKIGKILGPGSGNIEERVREDFLHASILI